jgi:hypothetical protein
MRRPGEASPAFGDARDGFANGINIHVMSRKVAEPYGYMGLASNATSAGDFAFRSGDTKSS